MKEDRKKYFKSPKINTRKFGVTASQYTNPTQAVPTSFAEEFPSQPKPEPTKDKYPHAWLFFAIVIGIPLLFTLGLFMPTTIIRYIVVGVIVVLLSLLWILNLFAPPPRNIVTIISVLLCGILIVLPVNPPLPKKSDSHFVDPKMAFSSNPLIGTTVSPEQLAESHAPIPTPSNKPIPTAEVLHQSKAKIQLDNFLQLWMQNKTNEMLLLCTADWINQQEMPEKELFNILGLSKPISYKVNNVYGSDIDTARTADVTIEMLQSSGNNVFKLFQIILTRSNDSWFIDPNSLSSSTVVTVTPTPVPGQQVNPTLLPGQIFTPVPPPTLPPNLQLYYNPDNGSYYHSDPNCSSTDPAFLPFAGSLMYSQLNSKEFKALKRCRTCDAPERPTIQ